MSHAVRVTCTALFTCTLVLAPAYARAQDSQAQDLRAQLELMRQQLEALQQKVAALEAAAGQRPAAPEAVVPIPAVVPPTQVPPPAAEPQATVVQAQGQVPSSKVFNPDISVIGNFVGAAGNNSIDPLPALRLQEAEASFQAVVDPYARADFFLAASPEGLEVEEGFVTFPTLPGGLLMKVGKMKAQFGKANTLHAHNLPWVDQPMPIKNLLGGDEGLNDSGISVSRLIMNPVLFLEATGEIYNGNNAVFTANERSQLTYLGRLRGYRDVTESTNLDIGTSFAYGHNDASLDSTTRVYGIDATLRYRPLQQALYKRAMLRTELFWSRREQPAFDGTAFGAYVSGEYQLARRLFAGARYDFSDRAIDPSQRDKSGSFLVTFWPSEFNQIRGQYRYTSYAEGVKANELLFQFLFSIGAHGAHIF